MGMADRQYSVSRPRHRSSTGPNPMEKRSTPTPASRATRKWPSSWMRMRTPMTTTKEMIVVTPLSPSGERLDRPPGAPPRLLVDRHARLDRIERARRHLGQHALDQFRDVGEPEA